MVTMSLAQYLTLAAELDVYRFRAQAARHALDAVRDQVRNRLLHASGFGQDVVNEANGLIWLINRAEELIEIAGDPAVIAGDGQQGPR